MLKDILPFAYSNEATLQNSFDLAALCKFTPGDFVECGVAAGAQVAAMWRANPFKTTWLFDSFQGIPLAGEHDYTQPGIGQKQPNDGNLLVSSGITSVSKEQVRKNLRQLGVFDATFNYVEGWFEETVPKNTIEKISLLRLDGDLYNSTKVCLEYLYPKVVKGGWVIIDDYGLPGCRKAVHDYFAFNDPSFLSYKIVPGTNTVIYFQKQ